MEDIEGNMNMLTSRIVEAKGWVAVLKNNTDTSEYQIVVRQGELKKLLDHIDDLDNRGAGAPVPNTCCGHLLAS